jgi:hypothetical protein
MIIATHRLSDDEDDDISEATPEQVAKKKKKNKNKKKKKNGSATVEEKAEETAPKITKSVAPANPIEDPVSAVIREIVAMGVYDRKHVEVCVGQLWDKGERYDNKDTVLSALKAAAEGPPVEQPIAVSESKSNATEVAMENGREDDGFEHVQSKKKNSKQVHSSTMSVEVAPLPAAESKKQAVDSSGGKVKNGVTKGDDRIEMPGSMATSESLDSAIDGACADISIDTNMNTLRALFKRIFESKSDLSSSNTRKIESLLKNVLHTQDTASVQPFLEAMQGAAAVFGKFDGHSDIAGAADVIAARVVNLLQKGHTAAKIASESKSHGMDDLPLGDRLKAFDEELTAVTQAISEESRNNGGILLDLQASLVMRDMEHDKLDLNLRAAETAVESIQPVGALKLTEATKPTPIELLGEGSEAENLQLEKQLSAAIKSVYTAKPVAPVTGDLTTCTKSLDSLLERQKQMKAELAKLEAEIHVLKIQKYHLQQGGNGVAKASANGSSADEAVVALMKHLRKLDENLTAIVGVSSKGSSVARNAGNGKDHTIADKQLALSAFSERFKSTSASLQTFVCTQSQCMALLSKRVVITNAKLNHLRSELDMYKTLNNEPGIAESTAAVSSLEENITEDAEALEFLQGDLIDQLARYMDIAAANPNPPTASMNLPTGNLHTAVQALRAAGVNVSSKLLTYIASPKVSPKVSPRGEHNGANGSVSKPIPAPAAPVNASLKNAVPASHLLGTLLQTTPTIVNPVPVVKLTSSKPSTQKIERVHSSSSVASSTTSNNGSVAPPSRNGVAGGKPEGRKAPAAPKAAPKSTSSATSGTPGRPPAGKAMTGKLGSTAAAASVGAGGAGGIGAAQEGSTTPSKSSSSFQGWGMIGNKMNAAAGAGDSPNGVPSPATKKSLLDIQKEQEEV